MGCSPPLRSRDGGRCRRAGNAGRTHRGHRRRGGDHPLGCAHGARAGPGRDRGRRRRAGSRRRLIDRWLVLHEVSRFAPPEPAAAAMDSQVAAIEARAGSPAALDAILGRGGFSRGRLAAWVRDDLRIAAYLDQRFATSGTPGEEEVAAYAAAHAEELSAASADDRVRLARARLEANVGVSSSPTGSPSCAAAFRWWRSRTRGWGGLRTGACKITLRTAVTFVAMHKPDL